ncbi:hypothetical protein GCM10009844_28760 [Nocardioides koreensis]|uniref:Uncharacterized protein n=1 Tax=Nocardioides koreensis TaxID=433651 RepID=A0ABP5LMF2_9ACTN
MSIPPVPPRRKHLMDPANPRPATRQSMSMSSVQRWVMSVLAVTTIGHFAAGLVIAAVFLDRGTGSQVGLDVIAGVVGVMGVAAGFMIHQKSPLTPWLVLGLLPAAVGLYFIL